jgi:AcrR family transcriptional regulator
MDKRSQSSQQAIRDAFVALVLSQRYDEIKASDIIKLSGVARSTFYQHYASKEAILASSLQPPMSCLADAIYVDAPLKSIEYILLHFWEKRSFCRLILQGIPGKAVTECLTGLIEERINKIVDTNNSTLIIEPHHAAIQIAEAQLALLRTWLTGKAKCNDSNLAMAIKNSSVAMLDSLSSSPNQF